MKTLNEQYQLIKEGKGHKGVFLNDAKRQFPQYIRNAATYDEASLILKQRGVINENVIGITPINQIESKKESFELAFEKFLEEAKDPQIKAKEVKGKTVKPQEEDEKAELKKPSKQVEEDNKHGYDHSDKKNMDNVIYGQMMKGYYAEMKDPKNEDKTMEQIRDIVLKNLEKDPMHYVKDGQFGVKGVGYQTELPGLGTPKEPTGKYKSSGYGDLKENQNSKKTDDDLRQILLDNGFSIGVVKNMDRKSLEDKIKGLDLKESAVRKIVRAIINEELDEITSSSFKAVPKPEYVKKHEREKALKSKEREPQDQYTSLNQTISLSLLKNENIKISGGKIFIEDRLRDPLNFKKLSLGTDPAFMTFLNDRNNIGGIVQMTNGKGEKVAYSLLNNIKVSPKTGNIQYLKKAKPKKTNESLMESIEKELATINQEAERETLQLKLDKIDAAIEKRQSQLNKLDEDEDMKNLTDKKKVKELEKDIKALEKAKTKVEKLMSKGKGKKKEVIEDGDMDPMMDEAAGDLDPTNLAKSNAELAKIKGTLDTISKTDVLEDEEESEY